MQSLSSNAGFSSLPASALDAFYAVGHQFFEQGDYFRAADVFRYVVASDSARVDGWWALGACHEQIDELEIAAALYEIAFSLSPDNAEIGLLAARARLASGERDAAHEILEAISNLDIDAPQRKRVAALVRMVEGRAS